jgi:hypothetical protein
VFVLTITTLLVAHFLSAVTPSINGINNTSSRTRQVTSSIKSYQMILVACYIGRFSMLL